MTDMAYQLASTRRDELLREAAARRRAVEAVAARSSEPGEAAPAPPRAPGGAAAGRPLTGNRAPAGCAGARDYPPLTRYSSAYQRKEVVRLSDSSCGTLEVSGR